MKVVIKADPLTTTRPHEKLQRTPHGPLCGHEHLKQTGNAEELGKRVPHELIEIFLKTILKYLSLFYMTTNHFLIGLWCMTTRDTSSVAELRSSSKAIPKANLATRKGRAHCLGGLAHCSSLNAASWGDAPKTAALSVTMPNCGGQLTLRKLNGLGYEIFPLLPYSPDLWPSNCHFSKHLGSLSAGKMLPPQQDAEDAFPELTELQSMDFYAAGINKFISPWKNMLIVIVPNLINKNVFGLVLMIWNSWSKTATAFAHN